MKFVFDLDGTIAPYKEPVPEDIATFLNTLGHIYVVTGGKTDYAKSACFRLTNATIIGMADTCDSIDLCPLFGITKEEFFHSEDYQHRRLRLVEQLNKSLQKHGFQAFVGGRSTIDIMKATNTKAHAVDGDDIYYFCDCHWAFNLEHSNDWPMIEKAKVATITHYTKIIEEVKKCLQ